MLYVNGLICMFDDSWITLCTVGKPTALLCLNGNFNAALRRKGRLNFFHDAAHCCLVNMKPLDNN